MNNKIIIITILLISIVLYSCSNKETEQTQMEENGSKVKIVQSEIIRTGEIDVEALDKNKDGKIYECPMDWNVISDKAGSCPVCGMDMKEYSIVEIKQNLTKYGYEYKK